MDIQSLVTRTFNNSQKQDNYQQMYEQAKKNTATFIKLVENEISKILAQHKKQKARLEKQNYLLKEQVEAQKKQIEGYQTYRKNEMDTSASNYFFEENARDIMNCGISAISLADNKSMFMNKKRMSVLEDVLLEKSFNNISNRKSLSTMSRTCKANSQLEMDQSRPREPQEQSLGQSTLSKNDISQLQVIKERYNKHRGVKKTNLCKLEGQQKVSEVLKKIRQKASTPRASSTSTSFHDNSEESNIIVPGMYGFLKKRG